MNKSLLILTALASAGIGAWGYTAYQADAHKGYLPSMDEEITPDGFEPFPISVSGTGRVKAVPDVAVITGTITAEHDFDHGAMDAVSKIINAVQDSVNGQDVELQFTRINMSEERDAECLAHNRRANARHWAITRDNNHNNRVKRLRENGQDTSLKPKPPQKRIAEKVCDVTHIEASLGFSARVAPADQAGDIINGFSQAGVSKVNLFGYDFSDYDALYKQASVKAVKNAEDKAKMVAKIAGSELTDIVGFAVSAPARQKRIGPQAMIISNHGNRAVPVWKTVTETVVVQPQAVEYVSIPPTYETIREPIVIQEASGGAPAITKMETRRIVKTPARTTERIVPAVTKQVTRRVRENSAGNNYGSYTTSSSSYSAGYTQGVQPAPAPQVSNWGGSVMPAPQPIVAQNLGDQPPTIPQNNALRMTMLAGPQTVSVTAHLQYLYETPINGLVIVYE